MTKGSTLEKCEKCGQLKDAYSKCKLCEYLDSHDDKDINPDCD